MTPARRVLISFLTPALSLLLLALALDLGLVKVIGQPNTVKQTLSASGVYQSVVPSLLAKNGSNLSTSLGNIPTDSPLVEQAAKAALPASEVKEQAGAAIDGIYAWLNGQTSEPNFNISLKAQQTVFADNLAGTLSKRLSGLPICTTLYTAASFDALNATCLPPGISAATAANLVRQQIAGNDSVLGQASLKASDIKGSNSSKSVFQDQLAGAPKDYRQLKKAIPILAVLAILSAAALVLLWPSRVNGLRHVGASFLVTGIVIAIFAYLFRWVADQKVIPHLNSSSNALTPGLRTAATSLVAMVEKNYLVFGVIYAALGIILIGGALYLRKRVGQIPVAN